MGEEGVAEGDTSVKQPWDLSGSLRETTSLRLLMFFIFLLSCLEVYVSPF